MPDKEKDEEPAADASASSSEKKEKKKKEKKVVEEVAEKKTHLGDTATIKRLMDDAVIDVFLDSKEGRGYVEDTSMSNLKLVVGFAGVGASLLSHVYPAPFPKNWWVLLLCCAFYFGMSGILQLLLSFVELESILVVRGKTDADGNKKATPGINISSHFPRFRPDVSGGNTAAHCLQRSWSVEKFFDEEGVFAESDFWKAVEEFVLEYERMIASDPDGSKKAN